MSIFEEYRAFNVGKMYYASVWIGKDQRLLKVDSETDQTEQMSRLIWVTPKVHFLIQFNLY